jgi:hypothetical protein
VIVHLLLALSLPAGAIAILFTERFYQLVNASGGA